MSRSVLQRKKHPQDLAAADENDDQFDLIDLFFEESLRPELEVIAEKYGAAVEKCGWLEELLSDLRQGAENRGNP